MGASVCLLASPVFQGLGRRGAALACSRCCPRALNCSPSHTAAWQYCCRRAARGGGGGGGRRADAPARHGECRAGGVERSWAHAGVVLPARLPCLLMRMCCSPASATVAGALRVCALGAGGQPLREQAALRDGLLDRRLSCRAISRQRRAARRLVRAPLLLVYPSSPQPPALLSFHHTLISSPTLCCHSPFSRQLSLFCPAGHCRSLCTLDTHPSATPVLSPLPGCPASCEHTHTHTKGMLHVCPEEAGGWHEEVPSRGGGGRRGDGKQR